MQFTSMWKHGNKSNSVTGNTQDRQWDIRYNVQAEEDLDDFLGRVRSYGESGPLKYILVGGVEIGTKPTQGDYQIRHVHVAAIFNNPITKSAIVKNFGIKEGNGYYMVPRNRDLPYSGWRAHHAKEFSKVDRLRWLSMKAENYQATDHKKMLRSEALKKKNES